MIDKSINIIPPSAKCVIAAENHLDKRKVAAYILGEPLIQMKDGGYVLKNMISTEFLASCCFEPVTT